MMVTVTSGRQIFLAISRPRGVLAGERVSEFDIGVDRLGMIATRKMTSICQ